VAKMKPTILRPRLHSCGRKEMSERFKETIRGHRGELAGPDPLLLACGQKWPIALRFFAVETDPGFMVCPLGIRL